MKFNFNKMLNSNELVNIGREYLGISINIYSRNVGPEVYPIGFYIINLDDASGKGTHWVAMIKPNNKCILWFDSFGFPAPQEQLNAFLADHDKVFYNKRQIQDLNSILCGYYCLGFFKCFLETGTQKGITEPLQTYAKMFLNDTKKNDFILKNYLRQI